LVLTVGFSPYDLLHLSMIRIYIIIIISLNYSISSFGQELLLYSSDNNTFLGCLNCNEFSSESICNEFGTYGSEFSSESIWNEFGTYGSEFSSYSPWNEFSSDGPKIVDKDGNYYGRFSINTFSGYDNSDSLKKIYDSLDGDLEKNKKSVL